MTPQSSATGLSWFGIVRLGLVQTALGAIVVLSISTINRLMIVELALPALVPGLLVGWHHMLQSLRPRWGHGSDSGNRRTVLIIGGMVTLAIGGFGAALAVPVLATHFVFGLILAILAYSLIGLGAGAAGTTVLVMLAKTVAHDRRPAAATIVWIMMIAGFVITGIIGGIVLTPYSSERLLALAFGISAIALIVTSLALFGFETRYAAHIPTASDDTKRDFKSAFREVWAEKDARRFAFFIFVSMLAYSGQELILEPFVGLVHGLAPGATTKLSGLQNGGVLLGMIVIGTAATIGSHHPFMALRNWIMIGCVGSAIALMALAFSSEFGPLYPLRANIFLLGVMNGVFAVSAIGSMFALARDGKDQREGLRMGLFGAAQALAFGFGGIFGTGLADFARLMIGSPLMAYAIVFMAEAALFFASAFIARHIGSRATSQIMRTDISQPAMSLSGG
jgi:BCD family chlorophyll transporter-like MFS transporter